MKILLVDVNCKNSSTGKIVYDLYTEFRKDLPEVGDKIKHENEDVVVINVDIPNRKYTILTESGTKEEVTVPLKCSGKCGKSRN